MKRAILPTLVFLATAAFAKGPVTELSDKTFDAFKDAPSPAVVEFHPDYGDNLKKYEQDFAAFCTAHPAVRCGSISVDKYFTVAQKYKAIAGAPVPVFFRTEGGVLQAIPAPGLLTAEALGQKADELYKQ